MNCALQKHTHLFEKVLLQRFYCCSLPLCFCKCLCVRYSQVSLFNREKGFLGGFFLLCFSSFVYLGVKTCSSSCGFHVK